MAVTNITVRRTPVTISVVRSAGNPLAAINVARTQPQIVLERSQRVISVKQITRGTIAGQQTVLTSAYNPYTRIIFGVDGGVTVESPVRVTIKNTQSGDGVDYSV